MQTEWSITHVDNILKEFTPHRMYLLKALHRLQDAHPQQYLPPEMLDRVARYFNLTRGQLYGVVTYYSMFSIKPRQKYIIRVCKSPVCYMKGSLNLVDYLKQKQSELGLTNVVIEFSECLGQCHNAPVMLVNREIHTHLTREKIDALMLNIKKQ